MCSLLPLFLERWFYRAGLFPNLEYSKQVGSSNHEIAQNTRYEFMAGTEAFTGRWDEFEAGGELNSTRGKNVLPQGLHSEVKWGILE